MSDPAVDAVRRARFLGSCGDGPEDFAENAAREALKPLQEMFTDLNSLTYVADTLDKAEGMRTVLRAIFPLIFATEWES